jgi:hypothetical protein
VPEIGSSDVSTSMCLPQRIEQLYEAIIKDGKPQEGEVEYGSSSSESEITDDDEEEQKWNKSMLEVDDQCKLPVYKKKSNNSQKNRLTHNESKAMHKIKEKRITNNQAMTSRLS